MEAALEWQAWKASLCPGCGLPRHKTFDKANEEKYSAKAVDCHGCGATQRRAWSESQGRTDGSPPAFGRYYHVTHDDE